ncbi:DUF6503 family protein [Nonlabens sp.]|uniref:DUF6503 family protein n=1 Tax=Nonlabens sp. TaxID=1888209 RepID=UPI003F69D546
MKKNLFVFLTFLAIAFPSCEEKQTLTAGEIMDNAIQAHGAHLLNRSIMDFKFRGITYRVTRDNGAFQYRRIQLQDSITITDMLSNDGALRYIDDIQQQVPDSLLKRYASSVNSVVYFAQLPYSLDGTAVYKELLGEKTIKNKNYYKIKVTFDEEGGGEDHEDEFIYWIDKNTFLIDYLAYSYCEEDCGYRFRESVNRRTYQGITVQDYKNYKEIVQDPDLSQMDTFFINGDLELLSEIKTEAARIELLH